MDHSHHGGSTGGTTGGFKTVNMALAQAFWYLVAGFVGLLVMIRGANFLQAQWRLRACSRNSLQFPTRPTNRLMQAWATATAIGREMSYPQLYIPLRGFSWLTPPPLGRVLVLLAYWAVVIYMMASDAIVKDVYFWERLGFRNAWVTMMQVPLLFLLASKANVLGYLVGSSHERLNWMHRWVARTMLVTGAVHGWHFWHQWVIADFVEYELEMMPMVKYGLGAWAILLWALVTTLAPLRHAWYELFVAQHILSAVFFLWLLSVHVPVTAQPYLWLAVASLSFDRLCRIVILVWQNVRLRPNRSRGEGGQLVGHQAQLRAVGDTITLVTIKDVHFRWRAGQHLYLWVPWIGPLEAHPYTIACAAQLPGQAPDTCICNSVQLVVRKHGGFSKRLHQFAAKAQLKGGEGACTVFVSGPYGAPPRWDVYETLVLISASTGASFTLPILESVLHADRTVCTRRVDFLLAARRGDEIDYYVRRLHELIDRARDVGIELKVHIAVTREPDSPLASDPVVGEQRDGEPGGSGVVEEKMRETAARDRATISMDAEEAAVSAEKDRVEVAAVDATAVDIRGSSAGSRGRTDSGGSGEGGRGRGRGRGGSADSHVHNSTTRPDVAEFIRVPVEAAGGETSVVVCGGKSLVARVRNCVASLSDERGVHKGTGAQGIHLHVEEYSF